MDALDFFRIHREEVLTGEYFPKRPKTDADHGTPFNYDIVDESDRSYALLIEALKTDKTICTIKTVEKLNFIIKGYIRLQDGGLWQITGFSKHLLSARKQALRFTRETVDTEYVIRLIEAENPMGI